MVPTYSVFAFRKDDEHGDQDLARRGVPEWNLTKALRWALGHGCDTLVIELSGTADRRPEVTHHVCTDAGCPGGC